jgi:hypothetical protein
MTRGEWFRIAGRIQRIWPQPIEDATLAEWFRLVEDLDGQSVDDALTVLAGEGREFPPHGGILRKRVLDFRHSSVITFDQAWGAIHRTISNEGLYREAEARAVLVPMAGGIVWQLVMAMGGWTQVCMGGPDEYRPTDPGVWRSQAEHAWKALEAQRREDASLASIPSDLPRMKAAQERQKGLTAIADVLPSLPPRPNGEGSAGNA